MRVWDELFRQDQFRWKDPDANVVAFASLLEERSARSVLDLGCGAGRHLVYLMRQGFRTFGVDISEDGLELAHRWLEQERSDGGGQGIEPLLAQSDMSQIPFREASFDGLIGVHVIQHQTLEGIRRTAVEIGRVLRSGGLIYLTFASRRDSRRGKGQEIEPNTFIAARGPDSGVPHHYSSLAEIEELLDPLAILKVELAERTTEQGDTFSHWEVLGEKP